MKIQDTKGFVLVAKCIKNTKPTKAKIRFDYSVCKKKEILKKTCGRVYLICVDEVIYKIGYSKDKGGIKGTLSSYQSAMGGRPSIRNVGIHLFICKELQKDKKVEVYVKFSEEFKKDLSGLKKRHKGISISAGKEFEDVCKKEYKSIKDNFPKWNFKENNDRFPKKIREAHNKHRTQQTQKSER